MQNKSIYKQYDGYIDSHVNNVCKAFDWLKTNLPDIYDYDSIIDQIEEHDASKFDFEEYKPYAIYFYDDNKTTQDDVAFDFAWLHHQKYNPHHWQYWVLVNDDGTKALDMPDNYIIEMVCDHWSFSWKSGNLYSIFDWYAEHKDNMILSNKTRETYEYILDSIGEVLDSDQ